MKSIAFISLFLLMSNSFCHFNLGHNLTEDPKNLINFEEEKMSAKCGGVSSEKEPDDTVVEIVESIRPELETKLGQSFSEYKPISFKSQLVNGVNYFIKIHIGNDQYVHVRTHRSFAGEKTLRAVQRGKQLLDTIEYFDVEQQ